MLVSEIHIFLTSEFLHKKKTYNFLRYTPEFLCRCPAFLRKFFDCACSNPVAYGKRLNLHLWKRILFYTLLYAKKVR